MKRFPFRMCVAALLLAANNSLVTRATRSARARQGGQPMTVEAGTVNVRVDGPTNPSTGTDPSHVVLIHGFGAALDWWDWIVPDLARDFRVIRLDLLGHGGSEAPRSGYDIENQARLVLAVLDRLKVERAAVVGHSMGGEVTTAVITQAPRRVTRAALIDTPCGAEKQGLPPAARLYFTAGIGPALSRIRTRGMVRRGLRAGFADGFAVPECFVDDLLRMTYTSFVQAHIHSVAYRSKFSVPTRLAGQKLPVLVIYGDRDRLAQASARNLFLAVPDVRIEVLEGVGHTPMVEQPQRTLAILRPFLEGR